MRGQAIVRYRAVAAARRRHRELATVRRSLRLFADFRVEQTDPARFYRALAADSVAQLRAYAPLAGATVLDVGGGPGYFREAFVAAGASYLAVDADLGELSAAGAPGPGTVLGSALALPVRSGATDVTYSSNLLEHVAQPERAADEMLRVTRAGGVVFVSYTSWLSPWGGHETAPWHYLGGTRAARRYARRTGHPPKNEYGRTLFPLSVARMLSWAQHVEDAGRAQVLGAFPRYHPAWAYWLTAIPGVREIGLWNLVVVLRRR